MTKPSAMATVLAPPPNGYFGEGDFAFLSPLLPTAEGHPLTLVYSNVPVAVGQLVGWITLYVRSENRDQITRVAGEVEMRGVEPWLAIAKFPWDTVSHITPEQWKRLAFTLRYPPRDEPIDG